MNILIACGAFPPAFLSGGPIRSITAMLDSYDDRHRVTVLTNNFDKGSEERLMADAVAPHRYGAARVYYVDRGWKPLIKSLRHVLSEEPDVVYLNSLFSPRLSILFQIALYYRVNTKLVIAPRGELDPGALDLKPARKRAYLWLANLLRLHRGTYWHASTALEAENIRREIDQVKSIVIRENDTLLPRCASRPNRPITLAHVRPLNAVFLSRLAQKKGLHVALEALSTVRTPVALDVIGPPEDEGYVERCRVISENLPKHIQVRFLGPIRPENVGATLSSYDIMVLPTAGENFGHVIAESLSVSCPVMCSMTTPWTSRLRSGGGEVVETLDPIDWARAIDEYARRGVGGWFDRKIAAGQAYDAWRTQDAPPHFFELLEVEFQSRGDLKQK